MVQELSTYGTRAENHRPSHGQKSLLALLAAGPSEYAGWWPVSTGWNRCKSQAEVAYSDAGYPSLQEGHTKQPQYPHQFLWCCGQDPCADSRDSCTRPHSRGHR